MLYLKKFIILVLIGFATWDYYSSDADYSSNAVVASPSTNQQRDKTHHQKKTPNFRCDGREHCSQMTSRAEAVFFIKHCPNTKMDGDRDGIPCENDSRF